MRTTKIIGSICCGLSLAFFARSFDSVSEPEIMFSSGLRQSQTTPLPSRK
jgi:hypothetical protein